MLPKQIFGSNEHSKSRRASRRASKKASHNLGRFHPVSTWQNEESSEDPALQMREACMTGSYSATHSEQKQAA